VTNDYQYSSASGYSIVSNCLNVGNGDALIWKAASFETSQEVFVTLTTVDVGAAVVDHFGGGTMTP
jgi:hypothetical protein